MYLRNVWYKSETVFNVVIFSRYLIMLLKCWQSNSSSNNLKVHQQKNLFWNRILIKYLWFHTFFNGATKLFNNCKWHRLCLRRRNTSRCPRWTGCNRSPNCNRSTIKWGAIGHPLGRQSSSFHNYFVCVHWHPVASRITKNRFVGIDIQIWNLF